MTRVNFIKPKQSTGLQASAPKHIPGVPRQLSINVLLDRSGSMIDCKDATIQAYNQYIEEVRQQSPHALVSLIQFDSQSIDALWQDRPIGLVPALSSDLFQTRDMTPLYDAVVQTAAHIEDANRRIVYVIVTDGEDTASRLTALDAYKCLRRCQDDRGWLVLFLGANQDATGVGSKMGVSPGNCLTFDTRCIGAAMRASARATLEFASKGAASGFSDAERADAILKLTYGG